MSVRAKRRPAPNGRYERTHLRKQSAEINKREVCALIKQVAIIPAIRVSAGADAHFAAEAVPRGGIPIVQITMTVPGAVDLISHLAKHNPQTIVGAGSVLDIVTARRCLDAGAGFLTAPEFYPEVMEFALKETVGFYRAH